MPAKRSVSKTARAAGKVGSASSSGSWDKGCSTFSEESPLPVSTRNRSCSANGVPLLCDFFHKHYKTRGGLLQGDLAACGVANATPQAAIQSCVLDVGHNRLPEPEQQ